MGNKIDKILRSMSFGQTNGILQGSVLMNFIAEIVLGEIDRQLTEKLQEEKVADYHIIRYRDDYKILVNNPFDGEKIIKCLSEILIEFGMGLNAEKTDLTGDVVNGALKKDKLYCILDGIKKKVSNAGLLDSLLIIYNFAKKHSNSNQLKKLLSAYCSNLIQHKQESIQDLERRVLMGITSNIAYENPTVYPACVAIISHLLGSLDKEHKKEIIGKIKKKFSRKPNTDYLDIWLQRLSYITDPTKEYANGLCKLVIEKNSNLDIWNSKWLPEHIQEIIKRKTIINKEVLEDMSQVIPEKEFNSFSNGYQY